MGSFKCLKCKLKVPFREQIGTQNRNHCPSCLWSKHVDLNKPGDRKSECRAGMEPIGLTFKQEGLDKWGRPRQGELMVVHECTQGDKISINRIASDDNSELILKLFHKSQEIDDETRKQLAENGINLLTDKDEVEIRKQLYGLEPNSSPNK